MIRKITLSLCLTFSIWAIARFTHHQTEGLRLSKFHNNTPLHSLDFIETNPKEITPLLRQKFTYFGRGLQSFSFLGEDGTTVLKIFNNRYQKRLFFAHFLPNFYPFKIWKRTRIKTAREKLSKTFSSYLLASAKMPLETGLLYMHLNTSHNLPNITLIDKLGIAHPFNLNTHSFAIQRKAELVYPYLLQLKTQSDHQKAEQALQSLISLLRSKMDAGIGDRDPLIRTNFGFCNGQPMQIDLGPLYLDEALKDPTLQKEELKKITLSLKHWLEESYPELLETLSDAI